MGCADFASGTGFARFILIRPADRSMGISASWAFYAFLFRRFFGGETCLNSIMGSVCPPVGLCLFYKGGVLQDYGNY